MKARTPRRRIEYTDNRLPDRARQVFRWWSHPVARLYIIAGQRLLLQMNPDPKSHGEFFGEQKGSISYELIRYMQKHNELLYEAIEETCVATHGFPGVVHKLYERLHKVEGYCSGNPKDQSEHYLMRAKPATDDEIRRADLLLHNLKSKA